MEPKPPPHEKAAIVNLFLDFIGKEEEIKMYPYGYWLMRVGKCTYGQALEIIKSLEGMPIEYSKGGAIVNKLRKINGLKNK